MTPGELVYRTERSIPEEQLLGLYESVRWSEYTKPERRKELQAAVARSTYVATAWRGEQLVGLVRSLSDDAAICYVQDLLVHPDMQRTGIGRTLMAMVLERFAHVRSTVLLTDDEERQARFYSALGFANAREMDHPRIYTYIK